MCIKWCRCVGDHFSTFHVNTCITRIQCMLVTFSVWVLKITRKLFALRAKPVSKQFSFATAMKHTKRQYFRRKLFLCWFLKSALYWLVVLCTNTHLDNLVIHRSFCNDRDTKSLKYTILWKLQCAMLKEEKEWKI